MENQILYAAASLDRVEVRDPSRNEDNTWTMSGYAAVFDQSTTAFDNGFDRFTIDIDPHAFDNVFASQQLDMPEGAVHFNVGHDMNRAIAATNVPAGSPGSLALNTDTYGLRFLARVSRDDEDARQLAVKMRDRIVTQASFAFTVPHGGEKWSSAETEFGGEHAHRRILEINSLHDVCATPQGMFSQTVSGLEAYAKQLGQPFMGGHPRQPDSGGVNVVNPETESDAEETLMDQVLLNASEVLDMVRSDPRFGGIFQR